MAPWSQFSKIKKVGVVLGIIVVVFIGGSIVLDQISSPSSFLSPATKLSVMRNSYNAGADLGLASAVGGSYGSTEAAPAVQYSDKAVNNEMTASDSAGVQVGELTQKKIIRNGSLSLFVDSPEDSVQKIETLAATVGGFIQNSRVYKVTNGVKAGSIIIRVPADKFDATMGQIKELAREVDNEQVDSEDVTEQFVDMEARLRNLQAEEKQYLEIMKKAVTIDDTLQVSAQLGSVRQEIEVLQGQLQYLSRQVDMSTISVDLTSYEDVKVLGLRWKPLYEIKKALRGMLEGLTNYANAMINFILALPVIILWLATILVVVVVAWKILRWVYRRFVKKSP